MIAFGQVTLKVCEQKRALADIWRFYRKTPALPCKCCVFSGHGRMPFVLECPEYPEQSIKRPKNDQP
ncbi:hypothetical protein THS27_13235 [Thalassospira sp. MCCC 1A01428]|nr:hypothetical protein THS27_13235 [Thalassospira sp. MCCC 1A01428]